MKSTLLEDVLILAVMSALVALFAWIYLRDRKRQFGLWLLGWSAIFVHFAAPVAWHLFALPQPLIRWLKISTLIVAGTFFLLSVSEIFCNRRQRTIFIFTTLVPSLCYLTGLVGGFPAAWFYVACLGGTSCMFLYQTIRFYGLRSRYLHTMVTMLLPYALWAIWQAGTGHPARGMEFYLFGMFAVTGVIFFRRFRRFSPGVLLTAVSFLAWGLVFPVAA
ncbi:MAG TPA: hypothetical protein VKL40_14450, partial [Candidatus Angelobacter sp.]|nr:hypothetical protein [Candidatus Angelobacter sp.]